MTINDLPKGFRVGTTAACFKKAGRDDLGLIVSDNPCVVAGLFTQNKFKAAPVQVCQDIIKKYGKARAVVANSGQANACTGSEGLDNCNKSRQMISKLIGIPVDEILPLSTGVIGVQLKMDLWEKAVPALVDNLGNGNVETFTRAFMTTDSFPKFHSENVSVSGGTVRLSVMAKGAGMICPNMATMLCVVLTDAKIDSKKWQDMFLHSVDKTFNRVTVDGDTSTNDSIIGLANGASEIVLKDNDYSVLEEALTQILSKVSYMLVKDGEGSSKVIHINVTGAIDDKQAEIVARSVGRSQLVKTAIYGQDANWGRIVTAIGYSGADYDSNKVKLKLCGIERFSNGCPVNNDKEEELSKLLKEHDINVDISLGDGSGTYNLKSSDLGHEYVSLNADYRS